MLGVVTSRGGWGQQAPRARGRGSKPPNRGHGAQRRVSQDDNLLFSLLLLPSTLLFLIFLGDHRASPPLESSVGFTNNKQNCYSLKNVKKKKKSF